MSLMYFSVVIRHHEVGITSEDQTHLKQKLDIRPNCNLLAVIKEHCAVTTLVEERQQGDLGSP